MTISLAQHRATRLTVDAELGCATITRLITIADRKPDTLPGMDFRTTVELGGRTATGLRVPDDVVEGLGAGKRPPVTVTVGGYGYRTTVAPMGGAFYVPLAAEHREAAGVAAGQEVDVRIELDSAPRETPLPDDLDAALDDDARTFFHGLAASHRKEWVRWVEEAKKPETRAARIEKTAAALREGKKVR